MTIWVVSSRLWTIHQLTTETFDLSISLFNAVVNICESKSPSMCSVTWCLEYLLSAWPLSTMKIYPISFKLCQSKLQILSHTKLISRNGQKLFHFYQSCEVSPNLVALGLTWDLLMVEQIRCRFGGMKLIWPCLEQVFFAEDKQSDQMARLYFNIWQLTPMKIYTVVSQNSFIIVPYFYFGFKFSQRHLNSTKGASILWLD